MKKRISRVFKEFYLLIIIYIFLLLITSVYFYNTKNSNIDNYLKNLSLQYKMQYDSTYENFYQLSQNTFFGIINKPEIYDLVKYAYKQDEKTQAFFRNVLFEKLAQDYERLKNFNFKQLHFQFLDNTSFLRMHKPEKFGDDLTNARYSVKEVNKNLKPLHGFEIGKIYEGFRFVYPLFDANLNHIGSAEVSVASKFFEEKFEKNFSIDVHFLINRKLSKEKMFDESFKKFDISFENSDYIYKEYNEEKHYTSSTFFDKKDKILIKEKMNNSLELALYKKYNGRYYSIYFMPIPNIEGIKNAAYMVFYNDSEYIAQVYFNFYKMIFILILVSVLFFLFLNYRFTQIIKLEVKRNILTQQSKMAAIGEMIENIAHQWRQPLSVISVATSGMKLKKDCDLLSDIDFDNSIKMVLKNTEYLSSTIEDFRNYFSDKLEKKRFKLKDFLFHILDMFKKDFIEKNIIVNIDCGNIELFTYESQLKQSIINILKNIQDINKESIILITASESKNFFKIQIQDSCGGVDEKIIKKIFEPYFTTKHQSIGAGMGLYVSYEIITKTFNGQLTVENKEFEYKFKNYNGACFTILIDKKM